MNRDIVLFNSKQKIGNLEDIDEEGLVPIDFCAIFEKHFDNILTDGDRREIRGDDFTIQYLITDEPESNMFVNLYGENALFELINVSKMYNWQIFDTGTGQMLNLKNPERNGFENYHKYEQQILVKKENQQHHL